MYSNPYFMNYLLGTDGQKTQFEILWTPETFLRCRLVTCDKSENVKKKYRDDPKALNRALVTCF
jgi:hypothetical protein